MQLRIEAGGRLQETAPWNYSRRFEQLLIVDHSGFVAHHFHHPCGVALDALRHRLDAHDVRRAAVDANQIGQQ
jgi:hypothetical protein